MVKLNINKYKFIKNEKVLLNKKVIFFKKYFSKYFLGNRFQFCIVDFKRNIFFFKKIDKLLTYLLLNENKFIFINKGGSLEDFLKNNLNHSGHISITDL